METAIEPGTRKRTRRTRKTEFSIKELPEDMRREVLDRYRYWNVEDIEWWDCIYEDFQEKVKPLGFEIGSKTERTVNGKTFQKPTIYFSGFASQGDGASFEAEIDLDKYIRAHREELIKAGVDVFTLRKILNNEPMTSDWEIDSHHIKTNDHHYCHEMTMDIELCARGDTPEEIEKAFSQMQDFILEDARDLARELYKSLEAEHDYQTEDEQIIEALEANDRKFTKEGEDI